MKSLLLLLLWLPTSQAQPHVEKQGQAYSGARKRKVPAQIRGLSRQLNIFGDEGYANEQQRIAQNNFEARRKKGKGKGKNQDDSEDSATGIGLLPYEDSEDNSAFRPELPPLVIHENSAPETKLPSLEIHENSAPNMALPPLEIHENSAAGLELPPLDIHENSAPGIVLPPFEDSEDNSVPIHENSAPGIVLPPFEESEDNSVPIIPSSPTKAPNDYWSTNPPLPPSPTSARCQADSNGDFGSKDGDATIVNFLYQMELFPGITIQEATTQIESALMDFLIPVLFPEECGTQARRRRLQDGEYIGISSVPTDAPVNGFECVGVFVGPCFVVRGGVTGYSVGKSPELVQEEISSAIVDILESGAFKESLIDVVGITSLRDPTLMPPTASPSSQVQVPTGSSTQSLPVAPTLMPIRTPPPVSFMFPTISPLALSDGVPTSQPTSTIPEDDEEKPWILRFPWWGWLCIVLGVVFLMALKVAYDKYEQQKDTSSGSNDGDDGDLASSDGGSSSGSA